MKQAKLILDRDYRIGEIDPKRGFEKPAHTRPPSVRGANSS